ncbi:hypothetical protein T479_16970 [Lysinibacillus varians]|nr:hypothetical protein T479_16970 [Lysinibacillus varians]
MIYHSPEGVDVGIDILDASCELGNTGSNFLS